jgi:hypothetical protein
MRILIKLFQTNEAENLRGTNENINKILNNKDDFKLSLV